MWRRGFPTQPNYDDDGLNCGGFGRQYDGNGGKCGICGDPYDDDVPRRHEFGGQLGQGMIVDTYESGQVIEATVQISVYHKGYWIFKICPDVRNENQACFDQYPLELEEGGTRFYPPHGGFFTVKYRLPKGLTCDHCVVQWRYIAGNNWGVCEDGTEAVGCGNQENFGACSDITIKPGADSAPVEAVVPVLKVNGIDKGLLELLRNVILRVPPKKYYSKPNFKKKKNHRQPRRKNSKRKKVSRWPFD
ncbi:uncharacterized protein LOC112050654 [Bicyclus anynana]|uniref:Uncharacterized protein LOC112050654 n=1 Tax=Bicyclus anynana TaxID=110368 RepID=A0A6J1NCV7_BICAN|nr:uncharacterized protein LOC112050654 [Bicyclus anynana]